MRSSSVAVILNTHGVPLSLSTLSDIPMARVLRAEFAGGETAACVAATLEHECSACDLLDALRPWATDRGWSITLAPFARTS